MFDCNLRHGLAVRRQLGGVPRINLKFGRDRYLRTRSKHLVDEMRRKCRKLSDRNGMIQVVQDPETLWPALTQIERTSWKDREGMSIPKDHGADQFYFSLAKLYAETERFYAFLLTVDGEPIAHVIGLLVQGEYYALKTSYAASWSDYSPGQVLFWRAIETAHEAGWEWFNFLGERSRWKDELSTDMRYHEDVCLSASPRLKCSSCRLFRTSPQLYRIARWAVARKRDRAVQHQNT